MKILFVANDSNLYGSNKSMLDLIRKYNYYKDIEIVVLIPKNGEITEELKKYNIKYKIIRYATWIYPNGKKNIINILLKIIFNYFAIIPVCLFL